MSEYTLYIATALLVTLTILTSKLNFGTPDAGIAASGVRIEQASHDRNNRESEYANIASDARDE